MEKTLSIIKKLINRALKRANTDDPSPDEKSNEIAREADNGSQEPPKILFDGFAKSIYPYKDICFIKLKKRDLRPAVSLLCERLELPVVSFGDFIRAGVAGNEPTVFSGYGYIDSKVCYGSLKSDYKFEDVTVSSGAFEFFEYENGRVRAATDFFGVCALYIYEDDNLILVTNRAHMAAIFSSISDKREINYPLIYTDIMFSTYFSECKSINETYIKGLIRVNTLNYVELDDKISII